MAWSPDGNLLLVPGGQYFKDERFIFCAFGFIRNRISRPCFVFPNEEPVLLAQFCPSKYVLLATEHSIIDVEYKMYFCLASHCSLAVYSTVSLGPFYYFKDLHF